jgi:glycosyltransferase involved in cell wall biosynthesis
MNVLVIPSWYPSCSNPLSGIFCREQAEALATCTDCNVIVCDWGQKDGALSLSHPLDLLRALWWRAGARRKIRPRNERCFEFFEPTLIWSPSLPGGGNKRIFQALRRVYKDAVKMFGKIDLFHAHVCQPGGYLAARLSAETGVPFVITEHWGAFPGPLVNGRPQPEIELAMSRAAAVISVSRPAAEKIKACGYERVRVIPNLVDETRFVARSFPSGKFRFFSMAGIKHDKGFAVLLQAIARWSPPSGEVEFVIAGEGAQLLEFQRLAQKLGVAGLVRWIGAVSRDEAPRHFQECHAFVLASRHESFGIVFAEAIASGRPVIATRCGGPEDIVNDTNGFLVPVEDVAELAAALARMKEQHSQFFPETIRADFMRRFSRPAVTAQIRQLYSEVLAQKSS